MRDDEAVNTYERLWPIMPGGTIPLGGGIETWRKSDPQRMPNPWPPTEAVIDRGKRSYRFYCSHCHGPRYDGQATVGQSFYPLPTDLLDPRVQRQSDGELFYKISLGHKRHPPLQATVAAEDGWAVIHFLRAQTRTPRAASGPAPYRPWQAPR
jgi:mono/diheme cytochrome c family protein